MIWYLNTKHQLISANIWIIQYTSIAVYHTSGSISILLRKRAFIRVQPIKKKSDPNPNPRGSKRIEYPTPQPYAVLPPMDPRFFIRVQTILKNNADPDPNPRAKKYRVSTPQLRANASYGSAFFLYQGPTNFEKQFGSKSDSDPQTLALTSCARGS